jgi:hypothetical protein
MDVLSNNLEYSELQLEIFEIKAAKWLNVPCTIHNSILFTKFQRKPHHKFRQQD